MKTINTFLILFLTCLTLFGQDSEMEIFPLPPDLFESTDIASDIKQDKFGNIWMSHFSNGLTKYDGEKITNYRPDPFNPNAIVGGRLENFIIDSKGFIWIATFEEGVEKFDPDKEVFTHYRHDPSDSKSIRSNVVRALVEDKDGFLWVGTDSGLDKLDPNTGEFMHALSKDAAFDTLNQEFIRKLYFDKAGILWIGTGSPFRGDKATPGGLYKYNVKTNDITLYKHTENPNSLIDNRVSSLFEDSDGVFWVGTAGDGLHTMDREKALFNRHIYKPGNPTALSRSPQKNNIYPWADDFITFINEDEKGNIWIGTFGGGITKYDKSKKQTENLGMDEFGSTIFWKFLKTSDNLLWILIWEKNANGSYMFRVNSSPQRLKHTEFGARVICITETRDNEILFSLRDDGIKEWRVKEDRFVPKFPELFLTPVINMEENPKGDLWLSTWNGLYSVDYDTKELKPYKLQFPGHPDLDKREYINVTLQLDDEYLLVGTDNRGLKVLNLKSNDQAQYTTDLNDSSSIGGNTVNFLLKDHTGTIWVGTEGDGINKFDFKTGTFKRHNYLGRALHLFEDSQNRLWSATRGTGLVLYNRETEKFESYLDNTDIIKPFLSIWNIQEDLNHDLWLITDIGLIRLNPETGTASLFGKSWSGSNYTGRSFIRKKDGSLLLGTYSGILEINPDDFQQIKSMNIEPYINKMFIDQEPYLAENTSSKPNSVNDLTEVPLKHFQNDFSIEFGHVNFLGSKKEHVVQYQLENYDKAWRNRDESNIASYYRVPPGKYNFRIRASNVNGTWTEKTLTINMLPPWYQTWWAYLLFALLAAALLRAYILYRSRRLLVANIQLEEKVAERTAELKASQAQLIQSEKMASLGELTAGIAHEIQNPLNFVNNFSEVSSELLEEIKDERLKTKDERDEKLENEILDDLEQNLQKISHHGGRASGIVKGMLDHSKSATGEKELTDINALCDEYLRLSYHGLRAKDNTFNATLETHFDPDAPKINIVSQEIGRVLLNLINNAFYAVHEKQKSSDDVYTPTVFISTAKDERTLEIIVRDNGKGIPEEIKDKIFQPFFTTKPTGQGTGLGLSLSYDIVKAHGGELSVDSEEGEGTAFVVSLPIV